MLSRIIHLLPTELQEVLGRMPGNAQAEVEEIRVREDRPLEIDCAAGSMFASPDGSLRSAPEGAYKPSGAVCRQLLERITNHSLYAMEEELRRGYITVAGGHRIGLAGRTVLEGGAVRGIREVGGFNIRIAREVIGASKRLIGQILHHQKKTVQSVLILGPPQQGKTTVIRDLARVVSTGAWQHPGAAAWTARKVGIVDERSEIAACVRGVPTFDVGPRTDVMDACPKAEGMMMMLRSMSPEVLIVDEIGRNEDAEAIREASHAGVAVIASAHAYNLDDAYGRPVLQRLLKDGVFDSIVSMRRRGSETSFHVTPMMRQSSGPVARAPTAGDEKQAIARGQPAPVAVSSVSPANAATGGVP
ncbi:stage III sporulation protein AA [Paenibacillaceae bacterium]|nr:stage III sporulation protein AA [Paenibacillaceae bacterium]